MQSEKTKRIIGDTFERVLEKTPSGADFSEIRFYDEKMMPCKKQNATQCVIVEKMNDETVVRTTYGFVENKIE